MACKINSGLLKNECSYLIGGVNVIYLANKSDIVAFTDGNMDNIYDGVNFGTSGGKFYRFEVTKNTSSYTQTLTVSGQNKYWLQNVDIQIGRDDQEAFDLVDALSLGTFVAIVETRTGKKTVLGEINGLEASVGNVNSGIAEGDSAGLQITLSGPNPGVGKEYLGTVPV